MAIWPLSRDLPIWWFPLVANVEIAARIISKISGATAITMAILASGDILDSCGVMGYVLASGSMKPIRK